MTTREAVESVASRLADELVICTTGYTCREMQAAADRPGNFYMIGSMGLAASVGLGVALHRPRRKVVVLDGDGSVLMGLGNLAMAGTQAPRNFVHVVLDNGVYASTGGQPTPAHGVALERVAQACGYPVVEVAATPAELAKRWSEIGKREGPVFLLVRCAPASGDPPERVRLSPEEITQRFSQAVKK